MYLRALTKHMSSETFHISGSIPRFLSIKFNHLSIKIRVVRLHDMISNNLDELGSGYKAYKKQTNAAADTWVGH